MTNLSASYTFLPIVQCSVSNFSKYSYLHGIRVFDPTNIRNIIIPRYDSGSVISSNCLFIFETLNLLNFLNNTEISNIFKWFSFKAPKKNQFACLFIDELETNLIESRLQKPEKDRIISF